MIEGVRAIVTDIEGTTSSISFVKDVLFPYARARIPDYVRAHENDVADILNDVRKLEGKDLSADEIAAVFLRWMDEDKKITPLKTLQGLIWREGYDKGELNGHIYDDAVRGLKNLHAKKLKLYIYSSGSVAAQKLLFGHTEYGDMTKIFSGYFDTSTGAKTEKLSYEKIAAEIKMPPLAILFLSDSLPEIEAAAAAGFQTVLFDRESSLGAQKFQTVKSFDAISIREMAA